MITKQIIWPPDWKVKLIYFFANIINIDIVIQHEVKVIYEDSGQDSLEK